MKERSGRGGKGRGEREGKRNTGVFNGEKRNEKRGSGEEGKRRILEERNQNRMGVRGIGREKGGGEV